MAKEMIVPNPERKPPGFAPATKLGNLVFVSGQVGYNSEGRLEGNVRQQAENCFKNVEVTLKAAGATMSDVMKITCFLTRSTDYKAYAEVRDQAFPKDDQPASSTLIVKALARPEFLVEIEAIAAMG